MALPTDPTELVLSRFIPRNSDPISRLRALDELKDLCSVDKRWWQSLCKDPNSDVWRTLWERDYPDLVKPEALGLSYRRAYILRTEIDYEGQGSLLYQALKENDTGRVQLFEKNWTTGSADPVYELLSELLEQIIKGPKITKKRPFDPRPAQQEAMGRLITAAYKLKKPDIVEALESAKALSGYLLTREARMKGYSELVSAVKAMTRRD